MEGEREPETGAGGRKGWDKVPRSCSGASEEKGVVGLWTHVGFDPPERTHACRSTRRGGSQEGPGSRHAEPGRTRKVQLAQ